MDRNVGKFIEVCYKKRKRVKPVMWILAILLTIGFCFLFQISFSEECMVDILSCFVLGVIIAYLITIFGYALQVNKEEKKYSDILTEQCDPMALLEMARQGMEELENKQEAEQPKTFMESWYVEALNGLGRYEEALQFMDYQWQSAHGEVLYRKLYEGVRLNKAQMEENLSEYKELLQNSCKLIKKDLRYAAVIKEMEGDFSEAIRLWKEKKTINTYGKVEQHFHLAKGYMQQGEIKQAKKQLDYVVRHGGTTTYKKQAEEMLLQITEGEA